MKRQFEDYEFEHICIIEPEMENGQIKEHMPQSQYENKKRLPLNKHGQGPFCKFRIPKDLIDKGAYILTVDSNPFYVGKCDNLSQRYNAGFGQISPADCYENGRRTHCRINTRIYETVEQGSQVDLWFLQTAEHKNIRSKLVQKLGVRGKWNQKD